MPTLNGQITPDGPIVEIRLLPPQAQILTAAVLTPPVVAHALVDTGSSHSAIELDVLQPLQLRATGYVKIRTANGAVHHQQLVRVDLTLVSPSSGAQWALGLREVSAAQSGAFGSSIHRGLIGRDILQRATMTYCGPSDSFTLSW